MSVRCRYPTFAFAGGTTASVRHSDPLPNAAQTARGTQQKRLASLRRTTRRRSRTWFPAVRQVGIVVKLIPAADHRWKHLKVPMRPPEAPIPSVCPRRQGWDQAVRPMLHRETQDRRSYNI